jgi:hypothetical protein
MNKRKLTPLTSDIANNLEIVFALPMIIGEIGLAIWLISKSGKENQ